MPKPFIKNIATIHDASEDTSYLRLRIAMVRGPRKIIELPRTDTSDFRALERHLLKIGAELPTGEQRRTFIMDAVQARSPRQIRRVTRSGWQGKGFRTFATQKKVFGHNSDALEAPKRLTDPVEAGSSGIAGSVKPRSQDHRYEDEVA
ncbi:hypothetical protein ACVI1L_000952 [Bradyrhizobium sp. USDA 4516]